MDMQLFTVTVAEQGYRAPLGRECMSAARPYLGDSCSFYLQSKGLALMTPEWNASWFLSFAWFSGKSLKWSEQVRHVVYTGHLSCSWVEWEDF